MPGHDNHIDVRIELLDGFQGFNAVHAGDPDIQEDDVRVPGTNHLDGFGSVPGGPDLIAFVFETGTQCSKDFFFIVHKENLGFYHVRIPNSFVDLFFLCDLPDDRIFKRMSPNNCMRYYHDSKKESKKSLLENIE